MPIFNGPPKRSSVDTSRGVHIRALWQALTELEEGMPSWPNDRRVRIRTARRLLEKAYPAELVTDSDLEQALAEEDGDAVQDEAP